MIHAVSQVSYWHDAWRTTTDPAHITAELVFTLVFDGLIGGIIWKLGIKRWLDRRIDREHQLLDAEHGITADMHEHPLTTLMVHADGSMSVNGQKVTAVTNEQSRMSAADLDDMYPGA